jgi:hypothetical protein
MTYLTLNSAEDSPSFLPCESMIDSLYVPALAGTAMDVASPAALVMVPTATKFVVPAGANQTDFDASPLLRILMLLVPVGTAQLEGNT